MKHGTQITQSLYWEEANCGLIKHTHKISPVLQKRLVIKGPYLDGSHVSSDYRGSFDLPDVDPVDRSMPSGDDYFDLGGPRVHCLAPGSGGRGSGPSLFPACRPITAGGWPPVRQDRQSFFLSTRTNKQMNRQDIFLFNHRLENTLDASGPRENKQTINPLFGNKMNTWKRCVKNDKQTRRKENLWVPTLF